MLNWEYDRAKLTCIPHVPIPHEVPSVVTSTERQSRQIGFVSHFYSAPGNAIAGDLYRTAHESSSEAADQETQRHDS
jgi:hypothetical protein